MTPDSNSRPISEGSKALLAFYYHSVFFLAAALLVIHTILMFVGDDRIKPQPLLLGVEGCLAVIAMMGAELERHRLGAAGRAAATFLTVLGLFQVALCMLTGGLASPYFLMLGATSVLAGLTLDSTRATYVMAALACAYLVAMRVPIEIRGAVATDTVVRSAAETITALGVHVVFLLLAPILAARVARRHGEKVSTLSVQSFHDPLTDLDNRRAFTAKMEGELVRAERFAWPITMLILDLDNFKKLNDEHGHRIGDEVLKEVAKLLRDVIGPMDHIGRIGGEEFAIAAVAAEPHHGRDLADQIVRAFHVYDWSRAKPGIKLTVSIGVAVVQPGRTHSEPTSLIREVMERADEALYKVKKSGRDAYHVATDDAPASPSARGER